MNPILDRSAPGVRITLLPDEQAEGGEPLDLGDRIIAFTFEDAEPLLAPGLLDLSHEEQAEQGQRGHDDRERDRAGDEEPGVRHLVAGELEVLGQHERPADPEGDGEQAGAGRQDDGAGDGA